jgi:hypothetical protein
MICDHNVSFTTPEHSKVMWTSKPDAASAGRALGAYMAKGFSKSYLIGYSKCQYIDRMSGGQLKQGLIQTNGKPQQGVNLIENIVLATGGPPQKLWEINRQNA